LGVKLKQRTGTTEDTPLSTVSYFFIFNYMSLDEYLRDLPKQIVAPWMGFL
jgi:hypothetical protein